MEVLRLYFIIKISQTYNKHQFLKECQFVFSDTASKCPYYQDMGLLDTFGKKRPEFGYKLQTSKCFQKTLDEGQMPRAESS